MSAAFQIADSAAEIVRDEYIKDYKDSGLFTNDWLTKIAVDGTRKVASLTNSSGGIAGLTDNTLNPEAVKANTANLIQLDSRFANTYQSRVPGAVVVRARVFSSNPPGAFTIKATAVLPDGSEQTIVKGFGASQAGSVPLFAVLTRNINCAFCHVKINGDTGALSHVRPGWDAKSSCADVGYNERTGTTGGTNCTGDGVIAGKNAARGDTRIKGSLLGLQKFTDDTSTNNLQTSTTSPNMRKNLDGVVIENPDGGTQAPVVTEKYDGDKFKGVKTAGDLDGDGINNDIPAVDLAKAKTDSAGKSISVSSGGLNTPDLYRDIDLSTTTTKGGMYLIPAGSTYSSIQKKTSLTDTEKSGTLILIGTKADPITLPENFYFDGDIIVKGYVKGNGNVTASRNVYIAGELLYKDPPGTNGSGNYNDLSPSDADTKAYEEKSSKDSLRLFAGGNAIIGDYTNQTDDASYTDVLTDTNKLDNAFRQPETFFRQQFGLDSGSNFGIESTPRFFNKSNGEELSSVKDTNGNIIKYVSITGTAIASSNVVTTSAESAYDYIVKPGNIQSDGSFKKSLNDKEFRDILGVQTPKDKVTVRGGSSFLSGNFVDVGLPSTAVTTSSPTVTKTSTGSGVNKVDTSTSIKTETTKTTVTGIAKFDVTESKKTITTVTTTTYKLQGSKIVANPSTTAPATSGTPVVTTYTTQNKSVPGVLYNYGDPASTASVTAVETKIANQVERVDAYVYANRRIAGVVRGTTMQANGGFVTKEFGILATAVESSKYNSTNITAASTACTAGTTTASEPNRYCNGLLYGTDKSSGDANTDGTGLQINYDNRLAYYNAPLGTIPVGTVTFFRLGTLTDRTF